jgi:hypothetical protein
LRSKAEGLDFKSPVPTRIVSNGEFNPLPQTRRQRQFEERFKDLCEASARKLGMDRRQFLRSSCGMATAFVALNDVFGPIFDVSPAEAAQPEAAAQRANGLAGQFILDDQVHFVRDDYKVEDILGLAKYAGAHWNPSLLKDSYGLSLDRYKFDNFLKDGALYQLYVAPVDQFMPKATHPMVRIEHVGRIRSNLKRKVGRLAR